MGANDMRSYLQQELVQRCKKNPNYSLRAFAGSLQMDPSTLSKLLQGKRAIGKRMVMSLAPKLGLSSEQTAQFLNPSSDAHDLDGGSLTPYQQLTLDRFAVISDWYHFAILELMSVEGFKNDHQWIAKALGIRRVEVDAAVERLLRIGLIEISRSGRWKDKTSGMTTNIGEDMISAAHRTLQEQLLTKAIDSLSAVDIQERDHTAVTVAIDRAKLPEARERIKKFRRSLTRFLSEGKKKDAVFNLNVAFFPLTETKKGRTQ